MQFGQLPKSISKLQHSIFIKVLKFPHSIWRRKDFPLWAAHGGPHLTDLRVMNRAILTRAATTTFNVWRDCLQRLRTADYDARPTSDHQHIDTWIDGRLSPKFWDTVPIAQTLDAASKGFPDDFSRIKSDFRGI